ncbi:MAG: ABC transporter permease, partial [Bryobacteraceae bacterium]|nr:ABC transporter permease [Bryobacteraceae bacterium]
MVGLAIISVFVLVALMAPWLASFPADEQDLSRALRPPGWPHLLGTDELGRDIFSRVLFGARISLGFAVIIVLTASATGLVAGMLAGFYGGLLDEVMMRLIDILLAFPGFLLAIAIVSVLGGGKLMNVAMALAIYIVPGFARLTRAAVLT